MILNIVFDFGDNNSGLVFIILLSILASKAFADILDVLLINKGIQ